MANIPIIAILFVAFCVSTFFNFANAVGMTFIVVGHVYCNICRVEFEITLSQGIDEAIVKLECRNRIDQSYTYQSKDIVADKRGNYEIEVTDDYEESDCDVIMVTSPRQDCNDPTKKWRKARVVLTTMEGVRGNVRFANRLGFKKRTSLPGCNKVLKEMGLF
ncbi:anther-specific protein LAT52-like [Gossypium australe]|uniref:Anther-specific protein LAT52-like n=1 Tax=Gossypium australe TaxID=47621 RepID=A0A5B6VJ98_9ROSI|nr:anther-specific protein LAT52-like [Gossypium australe]